MCHWPARIFFQVADAATVTQAVADASLMPQVADGLQQGILDELYLGRLMAHPDGLAADPVLQESGRPVVVPGAGSATTTEAVLAGTGFSTTVRSLRTVQAVVSAQAMTARMCEPLLAIPN